MTHGKGPRGDDGKPTGGPTLWAAVGAGISLLLALLSFDPHLFTGGDNAHYYALAQALATGHGYVDIFAPGAPSHIQYPPGYPALLVPFFLVSGGSMTALKLVSWLALGGLLWGVWRLARLDPALPDWAAAAAVWTVGLYPVAQLYSHRVLSDLPYAVLVTLALATFQRASSGGDEDRIDTTWLLACGIAVGAFYLRAAGVTLFAGVAVWALLRRHWRRAGTAIAVFATGVAPWWLWTRLVTVPEAHGYLAQFTTSELGRSGRDEIVGELVERIREVAVEYGTYQFPGLFWPGDPPPDVVRVAGPLLGGTFLLLGVVHLLRSRRPAPYDLYVMATLALLPLWPWLGDRYMLTLAPFLWLYLLGGLDAASRFFTRRSRAGMVAASLIAGILLASQTTLLPGRWKDTRAWLEGERFDGYPAMWAEYFEAADWIGEHTPEDAVVLARKPTLVWYFSRRSSVVWPFGTDPEQRWRFILEQGVDYVLLEPSTEASLAPTLGPRQHLLTLVHRSPRGGAAVLDLDPEAVDVGVDGLVDPVSRP